MILLYYNIIMLITCTSMLVDNTLKSGYYDKCKCIL